MCRRQRSGFRVGLPGRNRVILLFQPHSTFFLSRASWQIRQMAEDRRSADCILWHGDTERWIGELTSVATDPQRFQDDYRGIDMNDDENQSPRINHISWGRMEVAGIGVGKDLKLCVNGK